MLTSKQIVQASNAAFNAHDLNQAFSYLSDSAVLTGGARSYSKPDLQSLCADILRACPDWQFAINSITGDGNEVVVTGRHIGTFTAPLVVQDTRYSHAVRPVLVQTPQQKAAGLYTNERGEEAPVSEQYRDAAGNLLNPPAVTGKKTRHSEPIYDRPALAPTGKAFSAEDSYSVSSANGLVTALRVEQPESAGLGAVLHALGMQWEQIGA